MKKFFVITWLITCIILIALYFYNPSLFTLESLKQNITNLEIYTKNNVIASAIIYIITYISLSAFPLPGESFLNILAGYLFGVLPAIIYTLIALIISSSMVFWVFRISTPKFAYDIVNSKFEIIKDEFKHNGVRYFFVLRLTPFMPLFITNVLGALLPIKFKEYLWTTVLGMLPIVSIYSLAGKEFHRINSIDDALDPRIIGILVLLAFICLLPIFFRKVYKK